MDISIIAVCIVWLTEINGISFPVAIISFTWIKDVAKVPDGWVKINFLLFHFRFFIQAIASESPQERKINEEEVGAKLWPASITLGNNIFIVEQRRSIEEDLQLTPIIQILCLFAYFKILFNSEDSPETLNTKSISWFFCIAPRPPCCKSLAEKATLGVPRLDKVAETFRPTR